MCIEKSLYSIRYTYHNYLGSECKFICPNKELELYRVTITMLFCFLLFLLANSKY